MSKTSSPWISRYERVLSNDDIRSRSRVRGQPVKNLNNELPEVACQRMNAELERLYYPTERDCEIISNQIERATSHAMLAYPDDKTILGRFYEDDPLGDIEPYPPTLITGPAGGGKTKLVKAIERILSDESHAMLGAGHGSFPLQSYSLISLRSQKSISHVLRPLAMPDIASGKVRISESDLPQICSQWSYKNGRCLFGVDETQFMTQSVNASTLITKALLAYSQIRTPWHFCTNYSLCWRLIRRPQEAKQRLLSHVELLLPEQPHSTDWTNYLKEVQIVIEEYFSFNLINYAVVLWNLCAGIKRELVKLLVHAYRICRRRGGYVVSWQDVEMAYASVEFCVSRQDIELMITHAAQGGDLREDLRCPFSGDSIAVSQEQYYKSLNEARATKVATAARDAAMNVDERNAAIAVKSLIETSKQENNEKPKKAPRKKRTLENLVEAGRQYNEQRNK